MMMMNKMTSTLLPLAIFIAAALFVGLSSAAGPSTGSAERHQQRETCGGLVEPPPPSSSSPSPPPSSSPAPPSSNFSCPLLDQLEQMCHQNLSGQDQVDFQGCIDDIRVTLSACSMNGSISSDMMVVIAAYKLKDFLSVHVSVKVALDYMMIVNVDGSNWGYMRDFVYVAIEIQSESAEAQIHLDASGDCPMMKAIRDAASASGNSQTQSRCNALIADIKAVLQCGCGYTLEQELGLINDLVKSKYPDMISFLLTINISGFGPMESMLDVCHTEKQILSVSDVLSGSGDSDCELLGALYNLTLNVSISITERVTIKQMHDEIAACFAQTTDVEERLQNVSAVMFQFENLAPWVFTGVLFDCQIGVWGDFYEMEFCSNMCHNYGNCGGAGSGPGTPPPVNNSTTPASSSTPAASSSAAPSSRAPSSSSAAPSTTASAATSPAPTTPPAPVCNNRGSITVIVSSCSCSTLLQTLQAFLNSLTGGARISFNPTFNSVSSTVNDNVNYPTPASKVNKCKATMLAWSGYNVTVKAQFYALQIGSWGKVQDYCACADM